MKINELFEGDVISFADKLASLSDPVKTSVPLIHRQRQTAKKRADQKIQDLIDKPRRELSYMSGETQILSKEDYDFLLGYLTNAFELSFGYGDIVIKDLSKELLHWAVNDCKKFIELIKKKIFGMI